MFSLVSSKILKYVLLLVLVDTIVKSCSDFKWTDTNYNNYIWSIAGEWRVIDCSVENNANVETTLWFENNREVKTDGERIKYVSKNKFNITDLKLGDMGRYYCKACGNTKKPLRINVKEGSPFATPEITKPPNSSIEYNSTVTLECSVKGSYADYEIIWFKETKEAQTGKPGKAIKLPSRIWVKWSDDYKEQVQREILTIRDFKQKNAGKYFCRVKRYAVDYVGKAYVDLRLQTLFDPDILINEQEEALENRDKIIKYKVSGIPPPDILWYKSVNGQEESLPIAKCNGKVKTCSLMKKTDLEVSMEAFIIRNISYLHHHNVTYICRAENIVGKKERSFTMNVKTETRLAPPRSEIQLYKMNLSLECKLSKDANPENISYTWAYCDKENNDPTFCQSEDQWKETKRNYSVIEILSNQKAGIRYYRCIAQNTFMKSAANVTWRVVIPSGHDNPNSKCAVVKKLSSEKEEKDDGSAEPIFLWQCIVAFLAIVLLLVLFFTYRRRNSQKYNNQLMSVVPELKQNIGARV